MAKDAARPGQEQERLLDGIRREMRDQLDTGILRLDPDGRYYRPTLFGAFSMTWKLVFPVKQIRAVIEEFAGRRLEKSLMASRTLQPIHPV